MITKTLRPAGWAVCARRTGLLRAAAAMIAALTVAPSASAEIILEGLRIVSARRVSQNMFEYVAAVRVNNNGPMVAEARLNATGRGPFTTVLDGSVRMTAVRNGRSVSADTIRFRQPRLAPSALTWTVRTMTRLTLSGVARTGTPPFVGASVTATVSRDLAGHAAAAWGRPNVESFAGGQSDGNGRFSVPIVVLSPLDFVTIRVTGPDGAVLGGIAGNASDLIAAAGGRSNLVTDAHTSRLTISPYSTSAWALGLQALIDGLQNAGNRITHEAQWRSLLRMSDTWAILARAVYIKALVENPALPRPTGYTDTFALALKDSTADEFRRQLQVAAPTLFAAGLQDLLSSVSVPYAPAAVPATLYVYVGDPKNGLGLAATKFQLSQDGTGTRQTERKTIPLTWQVDASGRIAITYQDTPRLIIIDVGSDYPCDDPPSGQVEALYSEESEVLARMHDAGSTALLVTAAAQSRTEVPTCPQYPPIISDTQPSEYSASVGVNALSNLGFPRTFAGESFGSLFYLTDIIADRPSAAGFGDQYADRAADILDFHANGSGGLRRNGTTFSWQFTPERELELQFANGDVLRMRHLADSGGIHSVWMTAALSGGPRIGRGALVPLDDEQITPGPDGVTLRNGIGQEQAFFDAASRGALLDFSARADGTGCRITVREVGPAAFQPATWVISGRRIDFDYYATFVDPSRYRGSRYLEALKFVPARSFNDLSTGGWITIESLRFLGEDPYDPATAPGRLQFMRHLGPASACQ